MVSNPILFSPLQYNKRVKKLKGYLQSEFSLLLRKLLVTNMIPSIQQAILSGKHKQAQELIEEAKNLGQQKLQYKGRASFLIRTSFAIANIYKQSSNLSASKEHFYQCLTYPRKSQKDSLIASEACLSLSKVLVQEQSNEEALKFSLKALSVLTQECVPDQKYMSLLTQGICFSSSHSKMAARWKKAPQLTKVAKYPRSLSAVKKMTKTQSYTGRSPARVIRGSRIINIRQPQLSFLSINKIDGKHRLPRPRW